MAFEITKLVKFSPKRNAAFDRIKAEVVEENGFAPGIRTFALLDGLFGAILSVASLRITRY